MTEETETVASEKGQPDNKLLDFTKVDALRKHMLLTVESMVVLLGTSRVSYYNWLKHGIKRRKTSEQVRTVVRKLVGVMSTYNWPNEAAYVANQAERLEMLQDMIKELDKEPSE